MKQLDKFFLMNGPNNKNDFLRLNAIWSVINDIYLESIESPRLSLTWTNRDIWMSPNETITFNIDNSSIPLNSSAGGNIRFTSDSPLRVTAKTSE